MAGAGGAAGKSLDLGLGSQLVSCCHLWGPLATLCLHAMNVVLTTLEHRHVLLSVETALSASEACRTHA